MNIFFFHIGETIEIPKMMVDSIKRTNPGSKIYQITDNHTLIIDQVDECLRFKGNYKNIMKFRFEAYSKIVIDNNKENIFLDTDMLVLKKLDQNDIFKKHDTVFCKRQFNTNNLVNINLHNLNMTEYLNKTMLEAWPFMGCFIATKKKNLFIEMNEMYESLEEKYKFWYGDQIILKKYFEKYHHEIDLIGEYEYANLLSSYDARSNIKIMHFKGIKKNQMKDFYSRYCLA